MLASPRRRSRAQEPVVSPTELAAALRLAKSPTGVVMPEARRRELAGNSGEPVLRPQAQPAGGSPLGRRFQPHDMRRAEIIGRVGIERHEGRREGDRDLAFVARDTANAVGLAAALVADVDPDAELAVVSADHVIRPVDAFAAALTTAYDVLGARPSALVTLGVTPTSPATGFGYVQKGAATEVAGASEAASFRE